jgi:hypothetical protein
MLSARLSAHLKVTQMRLSFLKSAKTIYFRTVSTDFHVAPATAARATGIDE